VLLKITVDDEAGIDTVEEKSKLFECFASCGLVGGSNISLVGGMRKVVYRTRLH
jgi:hypothetical protein